MSNFSHFCCGPRVPLQIPLRHLLKVTLEIIRAPCNFMNIFYPRKLSSDYSMNVRKKIKKKRLSLTFFFSCLPFRTDEICKREKIISERGSFFCTSGRVNRFRNLTCSYSFNAKMRLCGREEPMPCAGQFHSYPG